MHPRRPRPRPGRRSAYRSVLAGALVACGALAALAPSPASATIWRAAATDPVDGGIAAGRDIVRAELAYDDVAGAVSTTLTLSGTPTGDRGVALQLGRADGAGNCGRPALMVAGVALAAGGTGGSWKTIDAGGATVAAGDHAPLQEAGSSATLSAGAPAIAGGAYDCALVQTADVDGGGSTLRDELRFPALVADAPAAPPAPPAPPAPVLPATPTPKPPTPSKAPALRVTASGLPKDVVRNRRYRVTVRVRNVGTAVAKRLTLRVPKVAGVRVTPTRAGWKRLAAGRTATRRLTVRATGKRTRSVRLRVTGSGKLAATATLRVAPKVAKRKAKPKKRKAPKSKTADAPLAGRYFWGFKSQLDRGWDNYAVLFVDDRWAYVGFPERGVPSCKKAVTEGDGCRRYTLNAKTGSLKVGKLKGRLKGAWKSRGKGALTFDDLSMSELAFAKPGARFALSLQHKDFSGQCGFVTGCTTWSNYFAMDTKGNFVTSGSSVGTIGGTGGGPYVWSGAFPADETGTYEILSRGRIRLAYRNGKVDVRTLGLELDRRGRPAPATEGLLLGSTNFYE